MAKVLVVEADNNLRHVLHSLLSLEGHTVIEAFSGESGLALALAERPDAVLCSFRLPDMDGIAVLAAIRANPTVATLPFVLAAAHLSNSDILRARQLRVSEFLMQPFTTSELSHKLECALTR